MHVSISIHQPFGRFTKIKAKKNTKYRLCVKIKLNHTEIQHLYNIERITRRKRVLERIFGANKATRVKISTTNFGSF